MAAMKGKGMMAPPFGKKDAAPTKGKAPPAKAAPAKGKTPPAKGTKPAFLTKKGK